MNENYEKAIQQIQDNINTLKANASEVREIVGLLKNNSDSNPVLIDRLAKYSNEERIVTQEKELEQVTSALANVKDNDLLQQIRLKQWSRRLVDWNKEMMTNKAQLAEENANASMPITELRRQEKISESNMLFNQIAKYETLPFKKSKNFSLEDAIEKLNQHVHSAKKLANSLKNEIVQFRGNSSDQEKIYDRTLMLLQATDQQYNLLLSKIKDENNKFIEEKVNFRTQKKLLIDQSVKAKPLLRNAENFPDEKLALSQKQLQAQLSRKTKVNNPLTYPEMIKATSELNQYNTTTKELMENLATQIARIDLSINNNYVVRFFVNYGNAREKINTFNLDSSLLDNLLLEVQAIEKLALNITLVDKQKKLKVINKKMDELIKDLEKKICDIFIEKIDKEVDSIGQSISGINKIKIDENIILNSEEMVVFNQLSLVVAINDFEKIRGSASLLQSEFNRITKQKITIQEAMEKANVIITTHRIAKQYSDPVNFESFIMFINDPDAGNLSDLFHAMIHYLPENTFLDFIQDSFNLVTEQGRKQLNTLIPLLGLSSKKTTFENQLKFIGLLENYGLNYQNYLEVFNSPNKINEVLFLANSSEELQANLSADYLQKMLSNSNLTQALAIITKQGITLTSDIISKLVTKPGVCGVIIQQNTMNSQKEDRLKLEKEKFSQILTDSIIPMEEELAQGFLKFSTLDNDFCNPQLLIYLTNSKSTKLPEIFINDEHRVNNLVFLKSLLTSSRLSFLVSNHFYFSTESVDKDLSMKKIERLNKKLNKGIEAIMTANQEPEKCDIQKIAQLFSIIQTELKKKNYHNDSDVERFMNLSLPWLLSPVPLKEKERHIHGVAQLVFGQKTEKIKMFADIMQIITGAILIIAPLRILAGRHPFFSDSKTREEKAVLRVLDSLETSAASQGPDKESQQMNSSEEDERPFIKK